MMSKDELKNFNTIYDENMECDVINFKVGETFRIFIGVNDYKIHICAIVDEEMVLYKYYGKHKQWWHYEVESRYGLTSKVLLMIKRGEELCQK